MKPKKRRAQVTANSVLRDEMVIDWLRNTPNANTRDCIAHFTPWLKTDVQKQAFTKLVKEIAQLKNSLLILKSIYRNPGYPTPTILAEAFSPSAQS